MENLTAMNPLAESATAPANCPTILIIPMAKPAVRIDQISAAEALTSGKMLISTPLAKESSPSRNTLGIGMV